MFMTNLSDFPFPEKDGKREKPQADRQIESEREQTQTTKQRDKETVKRWYRSRQADGEREPANTSELAMNGCGDSSKSKQDRNCFELAVWTDGRLCANYRQSA